jgi:hypothetical protein
MKARKQAWYNGGMEVGDWITLAAVIVALGIGVASILHTQRLQKRERRERLLNEIIGWAIRAARCGYEERIALPAVFNKYTKPKMELEALDAVATTARVLSIEGSYISNIALAFSDFPNLNLKVTDVVSKLDIVWRQAFKYMQEYPKEHKLPGKKEIKELRESAQNLIEEATKIKTGDMGKGEENMPKKGEATGSKEPTLKDIEAHLTRQDKEIKQSKWAPILTIGFSVLLVGVGFLKQDGWEICSMSGPTYFMLSFGIFLTTVFVPLLQKGARLRAYVIAFITYIVVTFLFFYFQLLWCS